ncbi:MAG: hypothetical protein HQM08_08570 [Candidatus Riflebacteria bacterium]|nr:hypothetical protein [Candidatus Riflebacteria bacterium]
MAKPERKIIPPEILEIEKRIKMAVREALLDHKKAGNPVAIWENGKVVIVPPGRIGEIIGPDPSKEDR